MSDTAPKFGTSGLRGLVTSLTPELVTAYTRAFLAACPSGGTVHLGWDLRPSSPDIARAVADAITAAGHNAIIHGALPTPALALYAQQAQQGAIMITGSHIPADRNGLKFYTPSGEITKNDEAAILSRLHDNSSHIGPKNGFEQDAGATANRAYVARYVTAFGPDALKELRIGVYQHSSVARDIMVETVTALGAIAIRLARSEVFIPVDTEAVDPDTRKNLTAWCRDNTLDALISTDGDADRPMVADATGQIIAGDVLGALTAQMLGASVICTPVSSNTMIEQISDFTALHRCRIGSPFVIEEIDTVLAQDPTAKVVGYEANGGFLLGFAAHGPNGPLVPLLTRDCLLPILAPLCLALRRGQNLATLVAALPARFTAADRLIGIDPKISAPFLETLRRDPAARIAFFGPAAQDAVLDLTDGLRVTFSGGDIVHLRPSGNAPEFRCYTEAASRGQANEILSHYLTKLRTAL